MNVKWLRRIKVGDEPFMTREETARYTDALRGDEARQFSFVMDAKSIITFPAYPTVLPDRGWCEVRGIAWSGRGRVTAVDVSADGGATWAPATLQHPVLPMAHTRFRYLWQWQGQPATLMSRATDETGYIQPTLATLRSVRGPGTNYHLNNIRGWDVDAAGRVTFAARVRARARLPRRRPPSGTAQRWTRGRAHRRDRVPSGVTGAPVRRGCAPAVRLRSPRDRR